MNPSTPETSIEIDKVVYQLKSIDEFGFLVAADLPIGIRAKGLLTLGDDKLEVGFRVRETQRQRRQVFVFKSLASWFKNYPSVSCENNIVDSLRVRLSLALTTT